MISAIIDDNKRLCVKTSMGNEFKQADSIVDGIVICSREIQGVTLEIIRQFYNEIEAYMSPAASDELKKVFLETTLQMVADKINIEGYQEYLTCCV